MKNIHAYTETHVASPGYISVNDNAGHLTVTARSRGALTASFVELNRDQLAALHADIGAYLAAMAPAPAPMWSEPVADHEDDQ